MLDFDQLLNRECRLAALALCLEIARARQRREPGRQHSPMLRASLPTAGLVLVAEKGGRVVEKKGGKAARKGNRGAGGPRPPPTKKKIWKTNPAAARPRKNEKGRGPPVAW